SFRLLRRGSCLFTTQPGTCALACSNRAFACLSFFLLATVISTTTSVPSTFDARMLVSDKSDKGGVSKITVSAPQLARATKNRCMAFESSRSGGFDGSGPEGITYKFGMPTAWAKGPRDDAFITVDVLADAADLPGTGNG